MLPITDAHDLPAARGAYALLLRLERQTVLCVAGRRHRLTPGLYVYAGSARGPGGIRARAGRHLRFDKPTHWHIDRLTAVAAPVGVYAWPGGGECALIEGLMAAADTTVPVPGFGSSDCRTCPAHLLRFTDGGAEAALDRVADLIGLVPARALVR